ncbi:MAG: hypothetical protein IPM57_05835 [Oligoflexia bacterium]|nr:hypothetical protein [Oligoflexia bacterium]
MLKLNSLFWATNNVSELCSKLEKVGFNITDSHRYPKNKAVYFGPDSFEIMQASEKTGQGIIGLEFESDDIANEYKAFEKKFSHLNKPMIAETEKGVAWYGFYLTSEATPGFESWIVMTSPDEMKRFDNEILPRKHSNSAFGFEAVSFSTNKVEEVSKKWALTLSKSQSKLSWNEIKDAQAYRVLVGDKFIDAVEFDQARNGAFMLTVRTVDLELAKSICLKNNIKISPCDNRDGFIIAPSYFDGLYVRIIRHNWKRYLPLVKSNFPYYRREDKFRPLGGAYTSTLEQGFKDDWSY